jgi:hypothetical protein
MSRRIPFRLQYASNLFVEHNKLQYDALVKPVTSTLALLGNIGHPEHPKTYHFLNYCSRNWDSILWVSGSQELTQVSEAKSSYTKSLQRVSALSKEFCNIRSLDGEVNLIQSNNIVMIGLPPEVPRLPSFLEKNYRMNLTHTMLQTIFLTMTNPTRNFLFLSHTSSEKTRVPLNGTRLVSPVHLWLVGDSKTNGLSVDLSGKQFFATNSLFQDKNLRKLPDYSPTAFVEIVDPCPHASLHLTKQSLQLA